MTRVEACAAATDQRSWRPLDLDRFDRIAALRPDELRALRFLDWNLRRHRRCDRDAPEWSRIQRLLVPLDAAQAAMRDVPDTAAHRRNQRDAAALVLHRSVALSLSFWGWDERHWSDLIGSDEHAFVEPWPAWLIRAVRPHVATYAYLLGGFTDFRFIGLVSRVDLAYRVFGRTLVDAAVESVLSMLRGWGYVIERAESKERSLTCHLLLCNRSPYLADVSDRTLRAVRETMPVYRHKQDALHGVHRALAALGHVASPHVAAYRRPRPPEPALDEWRGWLDRWHATSPLTFNVRSGYRSMLTQIGRWIVAEGLAATSPASWTRPLCAACVARVDRLRVGEYAEFDAHLAIRVGQPLRPATKAAYLCALRVFFRDCQEWGLFAPLPHPPTALATPRSIANLIGPDPRLIADDLWAKLIWAGLNLSEADLAGQVDRYYPFELLRALIMVWLFGGLRSDEIVRLRVGCIRWERPASEPGGSCLLDVPVHKTGTAFTKPVDPLLGQAVAAWEAVRPTQPRLLDRKTGERVHLLFAYRVRRVAPNFINDAIIPMLCRKGGLPRSDARGRITSHRARSTIATQLYNAKEPMTLMELQAWLGHRSPDTTQRYAKVMPTRLARAYGDAGYFARNLRTIEVLIDRGSLPSDRPSSPAEPQLHYDLGHGYCGYTFFEQCPHRMTCARCDFYTPKPSAAAQLLEAKSGLLRMLAQITLTEEEQRAVESDAGALEALLTRLRDVPTPAGPTPRQISMPITHGIDCNDRDCAKQQT